MPGLPGRTPGGLVGMDDQQLGRHVGVAVRSGGERAETVREVGLLLHGHDLVAHDDDTTLSRQLLQCLDLVVGHLEEFDIAEFDPEPRRDGCVGDGRCFGVWHWCSQGRDRCSVQERLTTSRCNAWLSDCGTSPPRTTKTVALARRSAGVSTVTDGLPGLEQSGVASGLHRSLAVGHGELAVDPPTVRLDRVE